MGAELFACGRTDGRTRDEAFVLIANALNRWSCKRHLLTVRQKAAFWDRLLFGLV